MNILLSTLQIMLALHTLMGAIWKFSYAETSVPSLQALPHGFWLALAGVEILCAAGLVLPMFIDIPKRFAPIAALAIAAEMGLFCVVHLLSGSGEHGHLAYWLIVAALGGFIAYGRRGGPQLAPA